MPLDLTAIRARWAAATPGPWEWESGAGDWQRHRLWRPIGCMEVLTPGWDGEGSEAMTVRAADAAAIAAAPEDLADLLSEVEAQQQEIARLRAELDAARPGVEWRENPRPGSVDTWVCLRGRMALWVVVEFPPARKSRRSSGWWISIEGLGVVDSGPETGDAGKAACYAAYLRACGLPPATGAGERKNT